MQEVTLVTVVVIPSAERFGALTDRLIAKVLITNIAGLVTSYAGLAQ